MPKEMVRLLGGVHRESTSREHFYSSIQTSAASSVAGSAASEQELMGEVANLLRTLWVNENQNPQLSAIRQAKVLNHDKSVLIDGGATHCGRNATRRSTNQPFRGC